MADETEGVEENKGRFVVLRCGVRGCNSPASFYPVVELTASNGRKLRCVVGAPTCAACRGGIHSLDKVLGDGGGQRFFKQMQRAFQVGYGSVTEAGLPVQLVARRLAWCRVDSEEGEEFRKLRADRDDPPDGSVAVGEVRS